MQRFRLVNILQKIPIFGLYELYTEYKVGKKMIVLCHASYFFPF